MISFLRQLFAVFFNHRFDAKICRVHQSD